MAKLLERISNAKISRRDFLKGSAVAMAAITAAGCTPGSSENTLGETKETAESKPTEVVTDPTPYVVESDKIILEGKGEWISAECWHNCGGRCVNKVYVVDGVVIRQKTDDAHEDTIEMPQQRSCLRGHSQQQQVFNADRIKYPMKRKHWQPGGKEVNAHLRGQDTWERISWDEALDIVASEIKRIYATYEPRNVLCLGDMTDYILHMMGGCVGGDGTRSYGSWYLAAVAMGTTLSNYNPDLSTANDRLDLVNADTIVLYGINPAWASGGNPSYYFALAKEAGAEFVFVGPSYNISANMLGARWIRVRPGTDTAFLLGVIYEMIRLDKEKGDIIDWDFVHKYSVGFDTESMPEDAATNENFMDYVLGKYDGIPKTPEWASEICGTPVEDITWYAEKMRKTDDVTILHSYAPTRHVGSEDVPQLFLTVGILGGHIGRPGNACGGAYHYQCSNAGENLVKLGTASAGGYVPNPLPNPQISYGEIWKCLKEGKYTNYGYMGLGLQHNSLAPMQEFDIDVKMIFSPFNNMVQSVMDINNAVEVLRTRPEFVCAIDYRSTFTTEMADIVLPAQTGWEGNLDATKGEIGVGKGIFALSADWRNREAVIFPRPVCLPLYEAKTDQWIHVELMKRLELDASVVYPISEVQKYYDFISGAQYLDEDGVTWRTIATITQEEIDAWGVKGEPQEGVIALKDLLAQGYFQVPRKAGDKYTFIGYKDFIDDPVANPRGSASGKFEIYCQRKADQINITGYAKEEMKPYPTYHKPSVGYVASFSDWENKVKSDYPFVMYQPHYLRRSHTTLDQSVWLQEAMKNPIFINKSDAEAKGIQTGDTVLVWSEAGKVLRHASVISSIMPGCVAMPHGPRTDFDWETGIDKGGNENVLLSYRQMGDLFPQLEGFNSCLVNFEKYDGDPIPADCDRDPFVMEVE
ncbi:MAG: molybdopterin-dependent oxidoreductase [Lachnospiraceae bacterium]|nr:molybdopterin-dependent oxidoreductase [Lachnospiraceae bacterium]